MEEGALLEPLAVGVYAGRRADIRLGNSVIIFGAGPIGLISLVVAKAMGATRTVVLDLAKASKRLEAAKKLGATAVIPIGASDKEDDIVARIQAVLGGPADRVLECTGSQPGMRISIRATRNAGIVCLVGLGNEEVQLPMVDAISREIQIITVMRYNHDYPAALEIVASGYVDVKPLVSHHFDLKDVNEAFRVAASGEGLKVMVDLSNQSGSGKNSERLAMAPNKNLAATVYGPNDLRLDERPIPEPAFNEVVVEVDSCGICGTDIHFLKDGGFGAQRLIKPIVLGHESAGVVRKVGSSVTHLKVGDRVAIEPAAGCRTCDLCKVGKYNI
uniref:Sorbitol dehydrogenase n=1 Tax=Anopheles maculatus TaxID=74869 RepID=A0A182T0T8_9DIPT